MDDLYKIGAHGAVLVVFGEDPRQGYVEGNIFYHPQLKFQFPIPSGWKSNNTPSQVQMFTQKQDAVIIFSLTSATSPATAANDFIANSKATVIKSEGTKVNGLSAHRVTSDITSEQGVISILSYFIQLSNKIYVFHGYTAQAQFDSYFSAFSQTMKQFKRLTDTRKINVKPAHLKIKKTTSRGSLRKALQSFGVAQSKMEELAIILDIENEMGCYTRCKF